MENFEREIATYEVGSSEVFSEGLRIGVVLRNMADTPLRQHLIMNAERLRTWKSFKDEVLAIRRAQVAPQPMD
eukprot:2722947-Amphidinium_carterae.1